YQIDGVDGKPLFSPAGDLLLHGGVHRRVDHRVELFQLLRVGEDPGGQGPAVQGPVLQKHRAEGGLQPPAEVPIRLQEPVIEPVAVHHPEPPSRQDPEGGGLAGPGGAGDADDGHSYAPSPRSTIWKPAAFFSRLATASPRPPSPGHWAKMAVTSVSSKARRASKTRRACSALSATEPMYSTTQPGKSSRYSSKQMTPVRSPRRSGCTGRCGGCRR